MILAGPHVIRTTTPAMLWSASAPIVKVLDDLAPLQAAREDAIRVFRHYFEQQDWGRSAEEITGEIVDSLGGYRHPKLLVEVVFNEVRHVSWPKLAEVVAILGADGVRCCGPCWATGDYDAEDWWEARRHHWGGLAVIAIHCYWAADAGLTRWNALRFAEYWHPSDPPIIISECGRDRVRDGNPAINDGWTGGGWRDAGISADQYLSEIEEYDRRLSELPYVLGAIVYTCGAYPDSPSQTPYDVDEIAERIISSPGNPENSTGGHMPEFTLGFAELADARPDEVGAPAEDEFSFAGRSFQETDGGLLYWRDGLPSILFPWSSGVTKDGPFAPAP